MLEEPYYAPGDEPDPDAIIYFVQAECGGPIKIGLSANRSLTVRLGGLQCGSSNRLVVRKTLPGDTRYERRLHDHFAVHRLVGEWFAPTPELVRFADAEGAERPATGVDARERDRIFNAGKAEGARLAEQAYGRLFGGWVADNFDEEGLRGFIGALLHTQEFQSLCTPVPTAHFLAAEGGRDD